MATFRLPSWLTRAAVPAPPVDPAKGAEVGISGTVNFSGKLQTENNAALAGFRAYGQFQTWGEFEKLVRTDAAVASALEMVAAPLREATIEVEAAGEDDVAKAQADFVRDNLQRWLEPQWPEVCQQVVKGELTFGFDIHEVVHGVRPDARVPGGQAQFVRKLAQRLPSSLDDSPWVEENGDLSIIRQRGYSEGRSVAVDLPAAAVLLFTWGRDGNNYAGYSALRAVWYLCKIREELLKIVAIGLSREATGIPVATQDKDAVLTPQQREELQTLLENCVFHENAALVLPKGITFEWVNSAGANKGHVIETWEKLGTAIKEVLFAQQSSLGTNGTGSRAVGSIHQDAQAQFVAGVKTGVEAVLNGTGDRVYTNLVKRIVDPNWGPQKAYPVVRLVLKKSNVPLAEFAAAVSTLKTAGALTWTPDDENEARERLGLAPLEEDTDLAATPAVVAPAATGTESVQDTALNGAQVSALLEIITSVVDGRLPRDSAIQVIASSFQLPPERAEKLLGTVGKGFKPSVPAPAPVTKFADGAPFTPRRQLRLSEQHLALADMDGFLTSARTDFERDVQGVLQEMVRKALPQVKDALKDGNPSELAGLKLDTAGLKAYVRGFVDRARAFGAKQVRLEKKNQPAALLASRRAGVSKLAADEGSEEEDDKNDGSSDHVDHHAVTDRTEKLVQAQSDLVTSRIESKVALELTRQAIDLVHRGGSVSDMVESVAEGLLEGRGLRNDAGMVLTRAFNLGRQEAADVFGKQIDHTEYSAVLDGNQCAPCEALDGQEFEFNSSAYDEACPPNQECAGGDQCRCLMVFVFDDSPGEADE